jgi:acyl carrier protein
MDETLQSVLSTVASVKTGSLDQLSADSRIEELRLDSLDEVEILMGLEDAHQVEIDQATVKSCATLGDLARLIDRQRGKAAGS